jgi:hypothetical protein
MTNRDAPGILRIGEILMEYRQFVSESWSDGSLVVWVPENTAQLVSNKGLDSVLQVDRQQSGDPRLGMSTPVNGSKAVLQYHEICLAPMVSKSNVVQGTMELGGFLKCE